MVDLIEKIAKKPITPNQKQQECINSLKGIYMVLAGPGTGKTFTITHRIKNMLEKGVNPNKILCLTFSTAASDEMKNRIVKLTGDKASQIKVYTYHAFCNDIITQNPSIFNMTSNLKIIKPTQEIELMKRAIDRAELEFYVAPNAAKYFFAKDHITTVSNLNKERLSKEKYDEILSDTLVKELKELENEKYILEQEGKRITKKLTDAIEKLKKDIGKAKEVWKLKELYQEEKRKNDYIDFSDMINFVLDEFDSNPKFLSQIANGYDYILVDEYQDTNELQNALIFALTDYMKEKNVFLVGDDDQIIFGFQGAKDDNLETFRKRYPETHVICLNENNRSTQQILDLSYELMKQNKTRIEANPVFKNDNISKKLTAKNQDILANARKVKEWHFKDNLQEINEIINDIDILIKTQPSLKLSEIAVLSRERSYISKLAGMLKARNIPYQVDEGVNIFNIRSSILVYYYMKALINPKTNGEKLFALLSSEPFALDIDDYTKIFNESISVSKKIRKDFISLMRERKDFKNQEKVDKFLNTYDYLKTYIQTNNLRNSVVEIINRTDIIKFFFECELNLVDNVEGIKTLIDEAESYMDIDKTASLQDFVKYLDESVENEIGIETSKQTAVQNAIQLLTYHGSKGREFAYVYMPNLIAKKWEEFKGRPNQYKLITDVQKDDDIKDSELLRLLFVGMTRAKYNLTLSFADFVDGKAETLTKYIANLENVDIEKRYYDLENEDYLKQYQRSVSNEVYKNKEAFKKIIEYQISKLELSPSRLNDYLECPRKFLYSRIMEFDIEEKNSDASNFGTAVHKVIENAERMKLDAGFYPSLDKMLEEFDYMINHTRFSSEAAREKSLSNGKKMIKDYYSELTDISGDKLYAVEAKFDEIHLDDCKLSGKIDRIELNNDGTYSLYDYKTGQPVYSSQVEAGKSEERYYRQLCFYKYAWEKKTGQKVSDVCLIYLRDTSKNVRKFLGERDIDFIKNLIAETHKNIEKMNFEPIEYVKDKCGRCMYNKICRLDII